MVQSVCKTVLWFLKKLKELPLDLAILSLSMYQRVEIHVRQKHTNVCNRIIHNSSKIETTQMSIN